MTSFRRVNKTFHSCCNRKGVFIGKRIHATNEHREHKVKCTFCVFTLNIIKIL